MNGAPLFSKTIICFIWLNVFAAAAFSYAPENAPAPQIEKVEPPNWWIGHTLNPVRVLVRGADFKGVQKIVSPAKTLAVSNLKINGNGTYLFFDLTIAKNAKPGKYEFEAVSSSGKTKIPFEILPPVKTNLSTITSNDVIYLVMTDRFADGDAANNLDIDRKNPRAWHGGDFRGIIKQIPYLKELGVTAVWLTPWYDNPDEANNCDKPWCPNTNYHGYHAIDYYGVENHFGTLADLREMIETCQKNGIKVIQDQVANHVGVQHPWSKNAPLENWFSPFSQNSFNNSVLLSPNASQSERDNLVKGWFNELLPDNNHTEPEVARYQIQNALWWIGTTGINGIRQDTIQYMPRKFIRDWSAAIEKQYPGFYLVGEVFERDSAQTAFFQGGKTGWDSIDTKLPSVFDFKLWETSQEVFTGRKPARALRDVLKYDGLYPEIDRVTTLTNNHDTDRFMSLKGATKEGARLHTAFILATRGIPQLYAGEEILMTGGHDPDNRKDFPGGFAGDKTNKFTENGRSADEQEMFAWTRDWIKLRKDGFNAVRNGKTIDLYYDDSLYVFGRQSCDHGECQNIFGFNIASEAKTVKFTIDPSTFSSFADADLIPLIAESGRTKLLSRKDSSNWEFEMTIPAKSAVAYRLGRR